MNKLTARLFIAAAGTSLMVAATSLSAQDKAAPKASPGDQRDRKVLVENEKVLVTENRYAVGATSGMSERAARVTRALSDGSLEKTYADGRKETVTWKVGQVRFSPKETYSQKNNGKTDVILYTVSLKQ
jgi:hypothetical protein